MLEQFCQSGKIDFALGGQFGSEGKGSAAAWLATALAKEKRYYNIITVNNGAQSGHTSVHKGIKRVLYHLPTAGVFDSYCIIYLNAGSVIDCNVLFQELVDNDIDISRLIIHPNAAIVTPECREAEMQADSAQTRIASTRKGIGEAISRKVLRSAKLAGTYDWPATFIAKWPNWQSVFKVIDLNISLQEGKSRILCEIPQGLSLSLNSAFYPHVTSRDCTVMQAMSDAGVHPSFIGSTMLVMRTFPIRVGNINVPLGVGEKEYAQLDPKCRDDYAVQMKDKTVELGASGGCYPDQHETSWKALGVEAEITTVTKRVRRVFTWSKLQLQDAMALCRPQLVYLTFCDYPADIEGITKDIYLARYRASRLPQIMYQYGPTTDDARDTPI